ncbi:MAG: helix-turn-helix transcriptional regulator [Clostridia bacterium]|nr:helix-turn-helix transcriptional regulator [Clostridia bacterium]
MTRKIDVTATGMNLRTVRMRKGYRVIDVADMMQVSAGSVSHWENGDFLPCTVRLVQLADLYGVPVDHLIIRSMK